MAKRNGIKVEEFGLGLPPRIWGKKKGETIYSVNWIPFGGFVRMLGEDSSDGKMLKQKRSFIAQSKWKRSQVIVAGVVMNFFLAWLLLTIGFTAGMQPLLTPDDVFPAVREGVIVLDEGLKVESIELNDLDDIGGFQEGDTLYAFNGEVIDYFEFERIGEDPVGIYTLIRDGNYHEIGVTKRVMFDDLKLYGYASFPRVGVYEDAGELRGGDVILTMNGEQAFNVGDFEEFEGVVEVQVLRNGVKENVNAVFGQVGDKKIVIADVMIDAPASIAGVQNGDIINSVNGNEFVDIAEMIEYVADHAHEEVEYAVLRGGENLMIKITPGEDGKIGVLLSGLVDYGEVGLYDTEVLSSIVEVKDEQYPFYISAYKSVGEGWRLGVLTAKMFVGFVGDLLSGGEVPDGVAGPVGIAQMTHTFTHEGIIPLLRFVAILSLSLGVINILPFPALDGGRLLFIILELVMRRRINQKMEMIVHTIGYVLIILLILVVTYGDIARLLS